MPAGKACDYNEKGRYDCEGGKLLEKKKKDLGHLLENCKINIIGEKDDLLVHFCDKCDLPIKIYGRIIPCKHVFCYACAVLYGKKGEKVCPGCGYPVLRIEEHRRGSIFMCSTVQRCKRTYLSQRDLKAHINYRHKRARKHVTRDPLERVRPRVASPSVLQDKHRMSHILPKKHTKMPRPPPYKRHHHPREHRRARRARLSPPPSVYRETFRFSKGKRHNLINVPIQDNSHSRAKGPPPFASAPAHRRPKYKRQPVASHHMPSQQHSVSPASPPPVRYPMPYSLQAANTPHLDYSKVPPPPVTSAPPTICPPGYMPPNTKHSPPGSPLPQNSGPSVSAFPRPYYNPKSLLQFTKDEESLSPPFKQPEEMSLVSGLSQEDCHLLH